MEWIHWLWIVIKSTEVTLSEAALLTCHSSPAVDPADPYSCGTGQGLGVNVCKCQRAVQGVAEKQQHSTCDFIIPSTQVFLCHPLSCAFKGFFYGPTLTAWSQWAAERSCGQGQRHYTFHSVLTAVPVLKMWCEELWSKYHCLSPQSHSIRTIMVKINHMIINPL